MEPAITLGDRRCGHLLRAVFGGAREDLATGHSVQRSHLVLQGATLESRWCRAVNGSIRGHNSDESVRIGEAWLEGRIQEIRDGPRRDHARCSVTQETQCSVTQEIREES